MRLPCRAPETDCEGEKGRVWERSGKDGGEGREANAPGKGGGAGPGDGDVSQEARLPGGGQAMVGAKGLGQALDGGEGKLGAKAPLVTAGGLGIGRDGGIDGGVAPIDVRVIKERGQVVNRRAAAHPLKINDPGAAVTPNQVGALEVAMDKHLGLGQKRVSDRAQLTPGPLREGRDKPFVEIDFPCVKGRVERRLKGQVADIGAVKGREELHHLGQLRGGMAMPWMMPGPAGAEKFPLGTATPAFAKALAQAA